MLCFRYKFEFRFFNEEDIYILNLPVGVPTSWKLSSFAGQMLLAINKVLFINDYILLPWITPISIP